MVSYEPTIGYMAWPAEQETPPSGYYQTHQTLLEALNNPIGLNSGLA